jgi:hypothetical protein
MLTKKVRVIIALKAKRTRLRKKAHPIFLEAGHMQAEIDDLDIAIFRRCPHPKKYQKVESVQTSEIEHHILETICRLCERVIDS